MLAYYTHLHEQCVLLLSATQLLLLFAHALRHLLLRAPHLLLRLDALLVGKLLLHLPVVLHLIAVGLAHTQLIAQHFRLVLVPRVLHLRLQLVLLHLHLRVERLVLLLVQLVQLLPPGAVLVLKRIKVREPWSHVARIVVVLVLLAQRLLRQTVRVVAVIEQIAHARPQRRRQEVALLRAIPNRRHGARFARKLDVTLAGRLAAIVHNDDGALHLAKDLKRFVQQLVGHLRRQVLDAHRRRVGRKADAQRPVGAHVSVQLALRLLGVGAIVDLDEGEKLFHIQKHFARLAIRLEQILQLFLGHVAGQVANVQTIASGKLDLLVLDRRQIVRRPLDVAELLRNKKLFAAAAVALITVVHALVVVALELLLLLLVVLVLIVVVVAAAGLWWTAAHGYVGVVETIVGNTTDDGIVSLDWRNCGEMLRLVTCFLFLYQI